LSLIEVARLSEPQRAALATHGDRWARLRQSTAPGDRAEAEDGVRKAYAAAGLAPPRQIAWGGGPCEIARQWVRARGKTGESVRQLVVDMVRRRAEAAVDRAIGLAVRTALIDEPRLSRLPPFCATIDEEVLSACERVRPPLRTRLRGLVTLSSLRSPPSFAASSFGVHSVPVLGVLEYLHDVCDLRSHTRSLAGLWQIARNASWMVAHEDICWLSDRPARLEIDANGRLHRANGPALSYRDGWSIYAWKGIAVPEWIIERPELIDVRRISTALDPQVRRCMIDIFTPARFVAEGGALRVSQDETGVLWRQRWRWEAWTAVEVTNGSPEPDGTYKHYFLQVPATVRSAREGVAWTYGLPEQRYRPIVRT
jgi:hypothetical protein